MVMKVVPIRPVKAKATKIDLAKADALALTILLGACGSIRTIAMAFHDTGRVEAATKMYEGIQLICAGHEMIGTALIEQMKNGPIRPAE